MCSEIDMVGLDHQRWLVMRFLIHLKKTYFEVIALRYLDESQL